MANHTRKHGACIGYGRSVEYSAWGQMLARCGNPQHPSYANYGGRGISVCDEWVNDFARFLHDVGTRPGPGYSIDRIDNDGPYAPGNVRWASRAEQQRNRRACHKLTHGGVTLTVVEWADRMGLKPTVVYNRINRGWSIPDALIPRSLKKGER